MKHALLATALGLSALAAHAVPTTIVIDDFNSGSQLLSFDTSNIAGDSLSHSNSLRTLSATLTNSLAPVNSKAQVSAEAGILDMGNGTGENMVVTVSWNIPAQLIPADALNTMFTVLVKQSDANPTNLALSFGGDAVGSHALPGNLLNSQQSFSLNGASFAAGGLLTLTISGSKGWDLSLDTLGLSYEVPAVPEPASGLLMVLGVAGLLGARRLRR